MLGNEKEDINLEPQTWGRKMREQLYDKAFESLNRMYKLL